MRELDRTAQSEPLTTGQSIVAKWEGPASGWSEPADLAEAIDCAIAAEREACAKIAEGEAERICKHIAAAIRARGGEVMPYAADKTELIDIIEGLLANWPSSEIADHYTAENSPILMKDEALKRAGDVIRARGTP